MTRYTTRDLVSDALRHSVHIYRFANDRLEVNFYERWVPCFFPDYVIDEIKILTASRREDLFIFSCHFQLGRICGIRVEHDFMLFAGVA